MCSLMKLPPGGEGNCVSRVTLEGEVDRSTMALVIMTWKEENQNAKRAQLMFKGTGAMICAQVNERLAKV